MGIEASETAISELRDFAVQTFRHVAEGKGLALSSSVAEDTPATLHTDAKRLRQILKNLLSNALKFTEQGEVSLRIAPVRSGWSARQPQLDAAATVLAFEVRDTGIGIPASQHRVIFEAFRQADGTATRRYGGTGLGLSISREIARLLGGEITLASAPGEGSTFTLYVPQDARPAAVPAVGAAPATLVAAAEPRLLASAASPAAVPALAAPPDDDRGRLQPGDAWMVLASADAGLAQLMTAAAHARGAKLVVAGSAEECLRWARRAAGLDPAGGGALPGPMPELLLDLNGHGPLLPDLSAWLLAARLMPMAEQARLRLGVFAPAARAAQASRLGAVLATPRPRNASEAEHYLEALMAAEAATPAAESLGGRRVLVVDDDPRNIFTLASALESHGLEVAHAEGGRQALGMLEAAPERFELVYMDIMMPEFDGYQTLQAMRVRPALAELPVIALTAKAMRGDRERCLAAGASDYLAKPVEMDALLELTRIWLPARSAAAEGWEA